MADNLNFKSHFLIYWKTLGIIILVILIINIIFAKYLDIISFTNLFLLIIPNWLITFGFNKYEIRRIQNYLKTYMEKNYPEKLKSFYENYDNDSNPGTKPIFALYTDKELLKDNTINVLKTESERFIFLLVAVSAISIMTFLISTVFIMKVKFMH